MKFSAPLIRGFLIKRYKRFLADVQLDDGQIVTSHCTNSGSMKSCLEPGAEVYLSKSTDPKRKTPYTWEMIRINGSWVGIHTQHPNKIAKEAIEAGQIDALTGYERVIPEVKVYDSRLDLMALRADETCFIEVKNVTLKEGEFARFPDAVTTRGLKHLRTLMHLKAEGHRAVMLYIIQRTDVAVFAPAPLIDPEYARALKEACLAGVEIIPLQVTVTPTSIEPLKILPFQLD